MLSLPLIVSYPTQNKILVMAYETLYGLTPARPSTLTSYSSLPGSCAGAGPAEFFILWTRQPCFQLTAFAFAVPPVMKGSFVFIWLALALDLDLCSEESYLMTSSKSSSPAPAHTVYPIILF